MCCTFCAFVEAAARGTSFSEDGRMDEGEHLSVGQGGEKVGAGCGYAA